MVEDVVEVVVWVFVVVLTVVCGDTAVVGDVEPPAVVTVVAVDT